MASYASVASEVGGRLRNGICASVVRIRRQAVHRTPRPWLGLIGLGLAASAALLINDPFLMPALAVCAWWWSPRVWFAWLMPLGAGALTVTWATVGAGLIAILPLPTAGLLWISTAAVIALTGTALRILLHERPR